MYTHVVANGISPFQYTLASAVKIFHQSALPSFLPSRTIIRSLVGWTYTNCPRMPSAIKSSPGVGIHHWY